MRKLFVLFVLVGVFGTAGGATSDPDLILTATPHRHYIQTDSGRVEVGPRYCDDADLKAAFTQFHANTHTHNGVTGEIGPVAPGLHNSLGGELVAGPC
jgi:hypothetical protein